MIARAKQLALACVPDRKGEIADQPLDAGLAPGVVGVQDEFAVGGALPHLAAGPAEPVEKRCSAIDARVGNQPDIIVKRQRLVIACILEGGPQQRMSQCDARPLPIALPIGPAICDGSRYAFDERWIE